MDTPLHSFSATKSLLDIWLIAPILTALACGMVILYVQKNTTLDYNRRNIVVMVFGFFTVIALGTATLKAYSYWRLKPVQIFTNHIITPYGETPLSNVSDFYIKLEKTYKPMQTDVVRDSARYFFLIEKNDKTHVLSEGDYPIYDILEQMNTVMGYQPMVH
jgi:hydrogenase maturation factor